MDLSHTRKRVCSRWTRFEEQDSFRKGGLLEFTKEARRRGGIWGPAIIISTVYGKCVLCTTYCRHSTPITMMILRQHSARATKLKNPQKHGSGDENNNTYLSSRKQTGGAEVRMADQNVIIPKVSMAKESRANPALELPLRPRHSKIPYPLLRDTFRYVRGIAGPCFFSVPEF